MFRCSRLNIKNWTTKNVTYIKVYASSRARERFGWDEVIKGESRLDLEKVWKSLVGKRDERLRRAKDLRYIVDLFAFSYVYNQLVLLLELVEELPAEILVHDRLLIIHLCGCLRSNFVRRLKTPVINLFSLHDSPFPEEPCF